MRTQMNRRGVSLLQLTLLMPALMVLFLLATTWIHQTMTFSSTIKKQQSQHLSLTRLADQFRRDVQRCQSVSVVNDQQVQLQNKDLSKIVYKISDHSVQCWQNSSAGQPIRQDEFGLASGSISKFDDSELPKWITLVIRRDPFPRQQLERQTSQLNETLITELHVRTSPNRWGDNLLMDTELLRGEQ